MSKTFSDAHIHLRASAITSFVRLSLIAICDIGPRMTAWRCHLGGGGKARTTGVGPSAITSTSPQTYYKIITISLNYKHNFNHLHSFIHSQSTNHQSQFTSYPPFIFCISHFKSAFTDSLRNVYSGRPIYLMCRYKSNENFSYGKDVLPLEVGSIVDIDKFSDALSELLVNQPGNRFSGMNCLDACIILISETDSEGLPPDWKAKLSQHDIALRKVIVP